MKTILIKGGGVCPKSGNDNFFCMFDVCPYFVGISVNLIGEFRYIECNYKSLLEKLDKLEDLLN